MRLGAFLCVLELSCLGTRTRVGALWLHSKCSFALKLHHSPSCSPQSVAVSVHSKAKCAGRRS